VFHPDPEPVFHPDPEPVFHPDPDPEPKPEPDPESESKNSKVQRNHPQGIPFSGPFFTSFNFLVNATRAFLLMSLTYFSD
jgi:hypothetical protein